MSCSDTLNQPKAGRAGRLVQREIAGVHTNKPVGWCGGTAEDTHLLILMISPAIDLSPCSKLPPVNLTH